MLQRQKGPAWWYKVKAVTKNMFENKKSKLWMFFWAILLAFNFLFSQMGRHFDRPYTSEEKVLGIPLFTTEPLRFALISVSGISVGVISVGGLSFGLLSLGGLALGWLALGGLAAGYLAFGGGAVAYYSIGGLAVGGYAYAGGGVALGVYEAEGKQKENLFGMKPHQEALYRKG